MTARFSVFTTPRFERLARKLLKAHPELRGVLEEVRAILTADPYNLSRRHPIKKLVGVEPGEGQWRLRSGRFRFRYDISGEEVWLLYCGLRSERTYR